MGGGSQRVFNLLWKENALLLKNSIRLLTWFSFCITEFYLRAPYVVQFLYFRILSQGPFRDSAFVLQNSTSGPLQWFRVCITEFYLRAPDMVKFFILQNYTSRPLTWFSFYISEFYLRAPAVALPLSYVQRILSVSDRKESSLCLLNILPAFYMHTLYRKFVIYIPRNETSRPRTRFLHSCIFTQLVLFGSLFSSIAWKNSPLDCRSGEKVRELPPSSGWRKFPDLPSAPAVELRVLINDQHTNFQFG